MVKQWAEKEVRNLKRIRKSGIRAPEPFVQKNNIILMEFVGEEGLAAPRLKDAEMDSEDDYTACYLEVLKMMRTLYQECRLVHGDLSEYNMLYF
jgi:RIO kinase 1